MFSVKQGFQRRWFRDVPSKVSTTDIYLNERAVRARAGIILLIPIILLFIRLDHGDHNEWIIDPAYIHSHDLRADQFAPLVQRHYSHTFAYTLLYFVMYEMAMAMFVRTSHLALTSQLGALLTSRQKPIYQPMQPKRTAWLIGLVLAALCQVSLYYAVMKAVAFYFLAACLLFMWLEAVCGICAGCHFHQVLVRVGLVKQACKPCDRPGS